MKKILSFMACIAMVVTCGALLTACGGIEPVRLASGEVSLGDVKFSNNSSVMINRGKEEHTYEVSGTASFMSQQQADAFWAGTAQEGDAYVILELDFNVGTTINYGEGETAKTYTNDTDKDDVLQIIYRVTDNQKVATYNVTKKDADTIAYKVTFANLTIEEQAK